MTNYRTLYLCLAAAFLMLLATPSRAAIVVNGSFEDGSFSPNGFGFMSVPSGSTQITGWTTFNAELAWIGTPNVANWPASDGNRWLDLTGTHDSAPPYGGVQQTLTTVSSSSYHVTFDLSVDQSSPGSQGPITVRVAATGNLFQDFTYNPPGAGIQWGSFAYDFVAAGTSTDLSLLGTFSAGGGTIGLDNVQASNIPEPSSLVILLTIALSGLAVHSRRQNDGWRRFRNTA